MTGHWNYFDFGFFDVELKLFEHNRVHVCFSNYNSLRYTLNFEISISSMLLYRKLRFTVSISLFKSVLMYSKEFFE